MNWYVVIGIVTALGLIYKSIERFLERRALQQAAERSDKKQIEYLKEVSKLEQEIADAKLTYDATKRSLDSSGEYTGPRLEK